MSLYRQIEVQIQLMFLVFVYLIFFVYSFVNNKLFNRKLLLKPASEPIMSSKKQEEQTNCNTSKKKNCDSTPFSVSTVPSYHPSLPGPRVSTSATKMQCEFKWSLVGSRISGHANECKQSLVYSLNENNNESLLNFKLLLYPNGKRNSRDFFDENALLDMHVIYSSCHWHMKVAVSISDDNEKIANNRCSVNVRPTLTNYYQRILIFDSYTLKYNDECEIRDNIYIKLVIDVLGLASKVVDM